MDTAHAPVGVGTTREAPYVAATRAREANRLYVDVEPEPAGPDMADGQAERLTAREVLLAVGSRRGAELSAHQTMVAEWAKASCFDQLVKEHQNLVATAMAKRWESALDGAGMSPGVLAQARRSPEWAGLLSSLRDADDRGLDVSSAMLELAKLPVNADRGCRRDAPGALAALGEAVGRALAAPPGPGGRPGVSGFKDRGPRPRQGRRRAKDAIAKRALDLAERAVSGGAAWAKAFGPPPPSPARPSPRPGGTAWPLWPPTGTDGASPP